MSDTRAPGWPDLPLDRYNDGSCASGPVQAKNPDRELWRETPGDYYAPQLFLTEGGGIGMDVGGLVIVKPIREWHKLASQPSEVRAPRVEALLRALRGLRDATNRYIAWARGENPPSDNPWGELCAAIDAADNALASPLPEPASEPSAPELPTPEPGYCPLHGTRWNGKVGCPTCQDRALSQGAPERDNRGIIGALSDLQRAGAALSSPAVSRGPERDWRTEWERIPRSSAPAGVVRFVEQLLDSLTRLDP